MRVTRAVGVGAFVLIGVSLFALVLFLIGSRRGLLSDSFVVYSEFRTISGLEIGTPVRVGGMPAGEVTDIQVPRRPGDPFRLELYVLEELHGLVRTDSVVSIRIEGLVGARYLQIAPGSEAAPPVPDGGTIAGREPFDMGDLLEQLSGTVRLVNGVIDGLRQEIDHVKLAIDITQTAAQDATELIKGISGEVMTAAAAGRRIAEDTSAIIEGVRAGRGTVGQFFADDEVYRRTVRTVGEVQAAAENVRKATEQARKAVENIQGEGGATQELAANLTKTLESTREAMVGLADATEAMKHNFLLRGFFNRRGYFNLSRLSANEYRDGVLEREGRRPLRIWLSAEVVFETEGSAEQPVLSDDGRQRLDSAIGQFLEYRDAGPLVVEGYAVGGDQASRYLVSHARASAVRDYLVRRFKLDPEAVGMLGLGSAAAGTPPSSPWDGIALAVFVATENR